MIGARAPSPATGGRAEASRTPHRRSNSVAAGWPRPRPSSRAHATPGDQHGRSSTQTHTSAHGRTSPQSRTFAAGLRGATTPSSSTATSRAAWATVFRESARQPTLPLTRVAIFARVRPVVPADAALHQLAVARAAASAGSRGAATPSSRTGSRGRAQSHTHTHTQTGAEEEALPLVSSPTRVVPVALASTIVVLPASDGLSASVPPGESESVHVCVCGQRLCACEAACVCGRAQDVATALGALPGARSFRLSGVFDVSSSQAEVYRVSIAPAVADVLAGVCAVACMYGCSGSGKTHTVFAAQRSVRASADSSPTSRRALASPFPVNSHDAEQLGVLPRACHDMFERMHVRASTHGHSYTVAYSVTHLTMNGFTDALEGVRLTPRGTAEVTSTREWTASRARARVLASPSQATRITVHHVRDVLALTHVAMRRAPVSANNYNDASSRCHTLFHFVITRRIPAEQAHASTAAEADLVTTSTLTFLDLAGSERVKVSGADVSSERLREARFINSSLHALGRVLAALAARAVVQAKGQARSAGEAPPSHEVHVPWRESKLTQFLQECLESPSACVAGASLTMLLCMAPTDATAAESLHTLIYGARALAIGEALAGDSSTAETLLRDDTFMIYSPSKSPEPAEDEQRTLPLRATTKSAESYLRGSGTDPLTTVYGKHMQSSTPAHTTMSADSPMKTAHATRRPTATTEMDAILDYQRSQISTLSSKYEELMEQHEALLAAFTQLQDVAVDAENRAQQWEHKVERERAGASSSTAAASRVVLEAGAAQLREAVRAAEHAAIASTKPTSTPTPPAPQLAVSPPRIVPLLTTFEQAAVSPPPPQSDDLTASQLRTTPAREPPPAQPATAAPSTALNSVQAALQRARAVVARLNEGQSTATAAPISARADDRPVPEPQKVIILSAAPPPSAPSPPRSATAQRPMLPMPADVRSHSGGSGAAKSASVPAGKVAHFSLDTGASTLRTGSRSWLDHAASAASRRVRAARPTVIASTESMEQHSARSWLSMLAASANDAPLRRDREEARVNPALAVSVPRPVAIHGERATLSVASSSTSVSQPPTRTSSPREHHVAGINDIAARLPSPQRGTAAASAADPLAQALNSTRNALAAAMAAVQKVTRSPPPVRAASLAGGVPGRSFTHAPLDRTSEAAGAALAALETPARPSVVPSDDNSDAGAYASMLPPVSLLEVPELLTDPQHLTQRTAAQLRAALEQYRELSSPESDRPAPSAVAAVAQPSPSAGISAGGAASQPARPSGVPATMPRAAPPPRNPAPGTPPATTAHGPASAVAAATPRPPPAVHPSPIAPRQAPPASRASSRPEAATPQPVSQTIQVQPAAAPLTARPPSRRTIQLSSPSASEPNFRHDPAPAPTPTPVPPPKAARPPLASPGRKAALVPLPPIQPAAVERIAADLSSNDGASSPRTSSSASPRRSLTDRIAAAVVADAQAAEQRPKAAATTTAAATSTSSVVSPRPPTARPPAQRAATALPSPPKVPVPPRPPAAAKRA